jgi:hypothetical protein
LPTTSARSSRGTWALYPTGPEVLVVHPDGTVSGSAAEVGRLAAHDRHGDLDRQAAAALDLLGGRVGRLILLAVAEIDDSVAGRPEQARLRGELEWQAEAVGVWLRERHRSVQPSTRSFPNWCCARPSQPRSWTESPPRMATA